MRHPVIRFLSTMSTCALLAVPPALSQGVPTVDTRNIAQEIRQLQQMLEDFGIQSDQLDAALEQIDLVQDQLDTLNETYAALTGATDIIEMAMGGDLDGLLDQEFSDLMEVINQIQTGDFSGLIGNATGAVMSAAAQNSYAEAAQSLERVDQLVDLIPDMETLKEAVDHNTRVTAELAIAMTRMWELEAVQTVGAGQAGVADAATLAEERRYMDFNLPDLR